jgi:hypothetical protein
MEEAMPVNSGNNEVDYQIVETKIFSTTYGSDDKEILSFRKKIIELLNNGYTPVGGISVVNKQDGNFCYYVQALIKQN